MFWIDYWYLIFVVPPLILALWASANVKSTYNKYSKVTSLSGMTGRDSAIRILQQNGIKDVGIECIQGELTDHFDPKTNVIRLSADVYNGTSVAALGVAAHEAGHAVQYAQNYAPMKIRGSILPAANIGSSVGVYIAILGIIFSFKPIAFAGIILFGFVVLFQLITLPVEFNASSRAITSLEQSLPADEADKVKKVLRAAALTYVAALLSSIGNLLRLIALANRRSGD